jgi:hypothetical protein
MWDVLPIEQVKHESLQISNPKELAQRLALLSYVHRIDHNMRIDDITVEVVDINIHLFTPIITFTQVFGVGTNCKMNCILS